MFKLFSLKTLLTITITLFLFSLSTPPSVSATGLQRATNGLESSAQTGFGNNITGSGSISVTIGRVVGAVLSFVGIIFLVLIIYAGFTWMLARGNEAEVKKAKDLMFDAIIGLVIIMAAYAITTFVGNNLAN